jgi:hypothetical protein
MKKIIILTLTIMMSALLSTVYAQVTPPGAGDKDLRDTNVKGRSNELDRIEREAKKNKGKKNDQSAKNPAAEQAEDKLAAKYAEIKTDYEQIQLSQDAILKAYQSGEKIDYSQISNLSSEINKSAERLNSNLFPLLIVENVEAKKEEKTEKDTKAPKSVREIIIDLDNTIGSFATSPIFQNLRQVDPKVTEKAKLDLEKIIELSRLLNVEAQKMTAAGK